MGPTGAAIRGQVLVAGLEEKFSAYIENTFIIGCASFKFILVVI